MSFVPVKPVHLADYKKERQAFTALLQPECARRILLFRGDSGSGKTTLLQACIQDIPDNIFFVPIQLRNSTVGVAEIFYRSSSHLGWENWENFTAQVASQSGPPNVEIDGNWLVGINNRINVALQAESTLDRESRRTNLTEAWFEDARTLENPLLIVLDTYERAPTEVADWLSGPFLARAPRTTQLRVVVAGQEVPDPHNIEWVNCCTPHNLCGVPEAEDWMPVVKALGLEVPLEPALTYMTAICDAYKGRPDDIMKYILTFPRSGTETAL